MGRICLITTRVVFEFLLIFMSIRDSNCHPQCLDFRPPFRLQETEGTFCSMYTDFGCCSAEQNAQINARYSDIVANAQRLGLQNCDNFIKALLCQECSPYAAHIYDAETTRVKRPLPGLCDHYCSGFYQSCRNIVALLTNDSRAISSLRDQDLFCSQNAIPDKQYCYPDILSNQDLQEEIDRQVKTEEGCLCLEKFADKLANPLIFRSPEDQSERIFVGLQSGLIYIYYKNGSRVNDPFMDLRSVVLTSSNAGDERGFLGLAFHPKFKDNGRFFIYFSLRNTDGGERTRISEFRVDKSHKNKADVTSERIILEVKQPYSNHNGGELLFGIDGYLYSFLGDGGAGGDPQNNAQNTETLLGSVLRLDIDSGSPGSPYAIPPDNPFANDTRKRPEIYAYGIRNVWRCDVDEGDPNTGYGRGRIICGDVGQSSFEEIDVIKNGGNYGWNSREGFECYRQETCGKIGDEVLPIHAYDHSVGNSVTGGHVYRGCLNPALQGLYIYGDYGRGRIFRLKETADYSNVWENQEITMCGNDVCFNGLLNNYERNILSFGEDYDGEIYILTTSWPSPTTDSGGIYRLVDPRRRGDASTCRSYQWQQTTQTTQSVTMKTTITTTTTKIAQPTTTIPTTTSTSKPSASITTPDISKSSTTKIVTSSGDLPACSDLVFVVDGSGSVTEAGFNKLLKFITQLTRTLPLAPDRFQIGVITFGNKASIDIPLNMYHTQDTLEKAILNNVKFKDENTNTSGGLRRMRNELFTPGYGHRVGFGRVGVLITDGRSTYDKDKTLIEAELIHLSGINMYVIAFGNPNNLDMNELTNIASAPTNKYLIHETTLESATTRFSKLWNNLLLDDSTPGACPDLGSVKTSSSSTLPITTPSPPATTTTKTTTATTAKTTTSPATTTSPTTTKTSPTTTATTTTSSISRSSIWSCDFERSLASRDQLCGSEQSTLDDFDWTLTNRSTPSEPTGPAKAYSGSYYLYIEASNPRKFNDKAILLLPPMPTSGRHCLSLYVHMYGFHIWELLVEIRHISGVVTSVWSRRGEEGNFWFQQTIQIDDLQPGDRIAIIGVRGREYSGDIAIDAIDVTNQNC